MTTKSIKKKCKNFLYSFGSPSLRFHFMYTNLNMVFYKFIMAGEKSRPPKPLQKIPVGSQARRVLNCLPKADELFIATELACESTHSITYSEDICELESTAGKYGGKYGNHYVCTADCTAGPDPASRLVVYSKSDQWLVTSGQPQAKKYIVLC
jgi:hypothetical protein